jgi:hypothetical protein
MGFCVLTEQWAGKHCSSYMKSACQKVNYCIYWVGVLTSQQAQYLRWPELLLYRVLSEGTKFSSHVLNSVDMKIELFSSRNSTSRNARGNRTYRTRSRYDLSFLYVKICGWHMLSNFHLDCNSEWAVMERTRILPREKNRRYYNFVYFSLEVSLLKYDVAGQVILNWIVVNIS